MATFGEKDFLMGHGLAWSYFYGYLKLVLPGMQKRIQESDFCTDETKNKTPFFPKLIIIMPESCYCPGSLTDDDPDIQHKGHIQFSSTRAGNISRNYKTSVYTVKHPETNEEFYMIAEYATPLLSMYEMEYEQVSGLTSDLKSTHKTLFTDKLTEILTHPHHGDIKDSFCILHFNDVRDDKMKPLGWRLSQLLAEKIKDDMSHT